MGVVHRHLYHGMEDGYYIWVVATIVLGPLELCCDSFGYPSHGDVNLIS